MIVDVYQSWEEFLTMGASFNTGIISVAREKKHYIQNYLKISCLKL